MAAMKLLDHGARIELPEPWARWEGEGAKAFAAFQVYLNQGALRSVVKVAQECMKSPSLVWRWSGRWNWMERARAYDNDQARQVHDATARSLSRQAALYTQISTQRLGNMTPAERAQLSPHETALFSRMAFELSGGSFNGQNHVDRDPRFPADTPPIPNFEVVVFKLEPTQVFAVIFREDVLDNDGSVLRSDGSVVKFGAESIQKDGSIRIHIGRDFIDTFRAHFPTAAVLV
jgi:hypothetical protein